jgi:hypothetical protein
MKRSEIKDFKNIPVHTDTHAELSNYGIKGETFDDIVKKILKVYKKYRTVYEKENKGKTK